MRPPPYNLTEQRHCGVEAMMEGPAPVPPGRAADQVDVLGVNVSVLDLSRAVQRIQRWIDAGERHYVCVTGVHGVMESQSCARLRAVHNRAGMVTPDGMPLAWLQRLAGQRTARRVCGPDLMVAVAKASVARGDRHFLYGATEDTLALLRRNLLAMAPGLRIVGTHAPPFRPLTEDEDALVVERINGSGADIVWIGLSTPKQEHWMAAHRDRLGAAALIGVGAAFDLHAGLSTRAPVFLQHTGLEWSYRLMKEPRRLWRRYAWNNPRFLLLLGLQYAGLYRRGVA